MTRRLPWFSLVVVLVLIGSAAAQTPPGGPSRYAPRTAAAGQPLQAQPNQGQAAQQQPARNFGQPPAGGQPAVRTAPGIGAQGPIGPQPVQQASDQQPIRPPLPGAGLPPAPIAPQQPSWFPLEEAQQKWVDQILSYWEQESSKVKTFECKFQRWEYDPVFGPKGDAKTFAEGVINYAQPDKGLYRVEKLSSYAPPAKPGDKPQYFEEDAAYGEHWVCNGKQVFAFNARAKQMVVTPLPPEVQGKAIVDGPLPFLFGAKAATIQARYWIRVLPETGNGKFWLEAVPKSRQDAQNFKMIHLVLDEKTFLPEMLQLFAPNYDAKTNPSRTTHVFKEVKTGDAKFWQNPVQPLTQWINGRFYEPRLPSGWTRVVENDGAPGASASSNAKSPAEAPKRSFLPLPR
jgi:TIGR03009 family protein